MSVSSYSTNNSWKSLQLSYITDKNCQLKPNQHSVKAGTRPSASNFLPISDLLAPCTSESSEKTEDAIEGAIEGRKGEKNGKIHTASFSLP